MVRVLRTMFDFVVVDMPPHFDDVVLALLEEADEVLLIASLDIPSIKNLKVGIQTLDLLSVAGNKLHLVMNRANARVHLDISDVERALGVTARVPHPVRHRDPAVGEPGRSGRARQAACARRARARARSPTGTQPRIRARQMPSPRRQPSRDAAAGADSEQEVAHHVSAVLPLAGLAAAAGQLGAAPRSSRSCACACTSS